MIFSFLLNECSDIFLLIFLPPFFCHRFSFIFLLFSFYFSQFFFLLPSYMCVFLFFLVCCSCAFPFYVEGANIFLIFCCLHPNPAGPLPRAFAFPLLCFFYNSFPFTSKESASQGYTHTSCVGREDIASSRGRNGMHRNCI